MKQTKDVDFQSVCDKGLTIDEDEISILEKINQSPFEFLDEQIILKIVPVDNSYEGIYGFPKGYFESDLNPFENSALAKHLLDKYGFELFGIGASFLGFLRNEKLDARQSKELVSDLSKIYNSTEDVFEKLFEQVQNSEFLFLKYIEYLEG